MAKIPVVPFGDGGAKIVTGSYVGTGTYGVDNPNTINLPSAPKFLVITTQTMGFKPAVWTYVFGSRYVISDQKIASSSDAARAFCSVANSGENFSWYAIVNEHDQGNASGVMYDYIVFL